MDSPPTTKQAQNAQGLGPRSVNQHINSVGPSNAEPLTSATHDMATRTEAKAIPGVNNTATMQKQSPAQGPT